LADIFTFWHPLPPKTFYRDIWQLPPGCMMTIKAADASPHIERYWHIHYQPDEKMGSEEEVAEELGLLLQEATKIRLRSDVPVGAYLSGGLDSSSTAGLIRHINSTTLRSFSVAFTNPEFDEYDFQQEVAQFLGTQHDVVRCSHDDIAQNFPDVVWHSEIPIVRTAPAPLFLLSGLVRQNNFKVVLTGEGADEVLGGYDIFKEAKIRRFWGKQPNSRLRPLLLKRLYPYMTNIQNQPVEYLKSFFRVSPDDLNNPFFSHIPRWDLGQKNALFFSDEVKGQIAAHDQMGELLQALPARYHSWDPFSQAQYLETTYLLPGYILSSQGDRMAMAHSVEGRFPFLDYRVVELGARIPPRLKMRCLNEKYILKRAMKHIVPQRIVKRPKQPYRAPDAISFFTPEGKAAVPYVEELLSPEKIKAMGLFQPKAVEKLVEKARRSRGMSTKDNMAFIGILSAQILCSRFACRLE
jgi:asparagine synthase (glutamine-hydrolysing)